MVNMDKKIMRASQFEKDVGLPPKTLRRRYGEKGLNFLFKMSDSKNSPLMIDTEAYFRWQNQRIKEGARG